MTQKICFDCFHRLFPDKPVRKVTLGRQCVVCKAQTDRTEQMVPVEAEDIPPVKQITRVLRRVRVLSVTTHTDCVAELMCASVPCASHTATCSPTAGMPRRKAEFIAPSMRRGQGC
jgi:hypothetical protein